MDYNSLSPLQKNAFEVAVKPAPKQFVTIKGFAGTGKTTVLSVVAKELGADCAVLAPTNKAANNLREKGINTARTIHSFLYAPTEIEIHQRDKDNNIVYHKDAAGEMLVDDDGNKIPVLVERKQNFSLRDVDPSKIPSVALVDEASMVNAEVYGDLLSVFKRVVFIGDPFQLPPVGGKDVFGEIETDIFLDEVHRVAAENPLIAYATSIREGKEMSLIDIKTLWPSNDSDGPEAKSNAIKFCMADNKNIFQSAINNNCQVLTGRNRTRHYVNEMIRAKKGYEPNTLMDGETVVSLKNIRDIIDGEKVLVHYNGQILEVVGNYKANTDHHNAELIRLKGEGMRWMWPFFNKDFFELYDNKPKWDNEIQRRKSSKSDKIVKWGAEFDYSYALTVHKSQGSEFDNVILFDEREIFKDKKVSARWYYTAVTRARKRLLVAR